MRIIYKQTMLEQLRQARQDSMMLGKEIEKVQLTVKEMRLLLSEIGRPAFWSSSYSDIEHWLHLFEYNIAHSLPQPEVRIMGISIEISR